MPDGQFCRHMSFDNTTSDMNEGNIEPCPDNIARGQFRNSARGFTWGENKPTASRIPESLSDHLPARHGSKKPAAAQIVLSPPLDEHLSREADGATCKPTISLRRRLAPLLRRARKRFSEYRLSNTGGMPMRIVRFICLLALLAGVSLYRLDGPTPRAARRRNRPARPTPCGCARSSSRTWRRSPPA